LENTPVATPVSCEAPWFGSHKHAAKGEKTFFPRWKRPSIADAQPSPRASHLLFSDDWHFEDSGEDLFVPHDATALTQHPPASATTTAAYDDGDDNDHDYKEPPRFSASGTMNATSAPIDIRGNRWPSASSSPRLHASNLTSALREAVAADDFPIPDPAEITAALGDGRPADSSRSDYVGNGSGTSWLGSGAKPISVKERPRRESNTGSVNGMSWSAMSVGSWIKDEYVASSFLFNRHFVSPCGVTWPLVLPRFLYGLYFQSRCIFLIILFLSDFCLFRLLFCQTSLHREA
jgi:hypothetical protein